MCMYGGPRLTQVGFLDHSPYTEGGGALSQNPEFSGQLVWQGSLLQKFPISTSHILGLEAGRYPPDFMLVSGGPKLWFSYMK